MNLQKIFTYPYPNEILLRKQKTLRRELLARENISYTPTKIAILGGSTVDDVKNILELFYIFIVGQNYHLQKTFQILQL